MVVIFGGGAVAGWIFMFSVRMAYGVETSHPVPVGEGSVTKKFVFDENLEPWANEFLKPYKPSRGAMAPSAMAPEAGFPLVLAAERTRRPDMLRKFKVYTEGWDIDSKHYWASVGFTGAAGFILALLWFVFFGSALVAYYCCRWRKNFQRKDSFCKRHIMLPFLLTFTCAAVSGCVLLSVGQAEFHEEVMDTLHFVVNQSDFTVQILRNVTDYLIVAMSINVGQFYIPSRAQDDIDRLNTQLNDTARMLSDKTVGNSEKVKHIFSKVRGILIVLASMMLVLAILGFLLSVCRYKHAIFVFIMTGWLLVAMTFILCGVFVVLNNVIGDTCTAMDEWVHNPQAQTALSSILPCVSQWTTNQTLYQSRDVVRQLVNVVNTAITSVVNSNSLSPHDAYYFNQSGPQMPYLCDPYNSDLRLRRCGPLEVSFTNASQVWLEFQCTVSASSGYCTSVGRLTPAMYNQLVSAVNVSYALDHYAPLVLSLQDCGFVRAAFTSITARFCPRLKLQLRLVNAGLSLISAATMLCLILWIFYADRPPREEVFVNLSQEKVTESVDLPTNEVPKFSTAH